VIELIEKYNVPTENLAIEFTESEEETNRPVVIKNLTALKEYGLSIYLDDYGSGITSYDDFLNYPVNLLKIDRDILYSANTQTGKTVFENIVALAQKLDIALLCEGAETEQQVEFLKKSNVKYIQGFYYYMPMESYECSNLFKENTK
jgi:EAL domain-containing protein (putative c-di-GMP-specific phosphodiesterase class I)